MGEVGEALLDDVGGNFDRFERFLGAPTRGSGGGSAFGSHAEGGGVEGGLWNQSVGRRETEDPGNAGGDAEEKDVPVETRGFAEGEFGALSDEGGDIVVWGGFVSL